MANLITVRLNKGDSPSWGFRLQGGKDFGAPLVIQKVNVGSPAERAGLIAGDSVIKVNNTDVFNLRHKDAQDVVVRAGPSFDITVQRGGSTWKPAVIPTGSLSSPKPHVPVNNISPVTKTSLAAQKSDNWGSVGTGHNASAKPFGGGAVNGLGPKLVNKQYNSPVNLYSEDTIAETLSAQAEVLANGVLGVNFKKNEKTYDASKSNVLRYVKEDELEPKSPEPAHDSLDSGVVATPSPLGIAGLRPVKAPENKPAPSNPALPPGQNICAECERLIVGVFVRIKEKNLHVECFKCSTCGTSLKNVGYYNINNKLYCDVHAKLAARNNPPTSNLAPVTIPPISRPGGGVSSLSPNSLPSSAPLSPNINSYAPPPFQTHDPYSGYICVRSNAPSLIKTSLNSAASRKRTVTNDVSNPVKTNQFSPTTTTYTPNYAKTNTRSGPNLSGPRSFSSGPLSPSGNSYSTLPKVSSTPLSSDCRSDINTQTNQNNELEQERRIEGNNDAVEDKLKEFSEITITIPNPKSNEAFSLESTSPGSNCSSLSSGHTNYHKQTASESSDSGKPESLHDGDLHYGPRINSLEDLHSSMELSLGNSNVASEADNSSNTSLIMLDHAYPNNEDKASLSQLSSILKEKAKTYREMTGSSEKQNFTYKHFTNAEESNSLYPKEVLTSVPICNQCNKKITRGPFVTALGKIWCPEHFSCATPSCKRPLQDLGFVEEQGQLHCEYCFERYLAPNCSKCGAKVKAECLKAIGKHFHPECFSCVHCGKQFGNNPFFLEDGQPYCDNDWNELFTTKCFACGFPIEAGDRWVEALSNNYHSQCFNCTMCKKNLEGQSFFAKGGRPFCKNHAR